METNDIPRLSKQEKELENDKKKSPCYWAVRTILEEYSPQELIEEMEKNYPGMSEFCDLISELRGGRIKFGGTCCDQKSNDN